jgi:hypothetical protein
MRGRSVMAFSTLRASPSLPHPNPLPRGGRGRQDPFGLPTGGVFLAGCRALEAVEPTCD